MRDRSVAFAVLVILGLSAGVYFVAAQSAYEIALGLTKAPVTYAPAIVVKTYNYNVPLANCMRFGLNNEFQFEWQINFQPKNTLETRFSADSTRGFTGLGYEYNGKFQVITGDPVEQTPCSRALYDTFSAFDIDGNTPPNYPEVPAQLTYNNGSYTMHYMMRNLSTTAARMLRSGGTLTTNLTFVWAFEQKSLFAGACYMSSVKAVTEMAKLEVVFGSSTYSAAGGQCLTYAGKTDRAYGQPKLNNKLMQGERGQSTRVALMLVGGDMLARSGQVPPKYSLTSGFVTAGENAVGVCQASLSTVKAYWGGFSDPIGGITEYDVSLGTVARPSLYADRVNAQTNKAYTFTGMSLPANGTIILTVQAYDFARLWTTVVSKPIQVLNGGLPVFGSIYDGTASQGFFTRWRYQRSTTQLNAYLQKWIPADHSTKNYYTGVFTDTGMQYAVGLLGGTVNSVLNWVTLGTFKNALSITGLSLVHGNTYTVTVRTTNCAGATTQLSTPGVTVDTMPPLPGQVYFGNKTFVHTKVVFKGMRVQASWRGFSDPTSGIAKYQWAMSNLPHPPLVGQAGLIMGWQDVGLLTFARNATLNRMKQQYKLTIGTNIYIHVKAFDNAGNYVIVNSNATRIVGF